MTDEKSDEVKVYAMPDALPDMSVGYCIPCRAVHIIMSDNLGKPLARFDFRSPAEMKRWLGVAMGHADKLAALLQADLTGEKVPNAHEAPPEAAAEAAGNALVPPQGDGAG